MTKARQESSVSYAGVKRGFSRGGADGTKAERLARVREAALARTRLQVAPPPQVTAAPAEATVVPEIATAPEPSPIIVTRGEIDIGEAFLRRAVRQSPGISVFDALRQIESSDLRLLCGRVAGAMVQVAKAGRTMAELASIEVVREKTPDGTRELFKCNYLPESPGQALLREFSRGS